MPFIGCQICGSQIHVRSTDAEVECEACGAQYDVLIHGSKTREVAIGAEKYPVDAKIYLGPSPMGPGVSPYPPGSIVKVGTKITIRIGLLSTEEGIWITSQGKDASVYHRLNTGAWERIYVAGWVVEETHDIPHTIPKAGTHTFYMEWPGTAKYAGCGSKIHSLEVAHYGVSPEVSLEASPALTVIVKDAVTKKLIEGAHVLVDAYEAFTDVEGKAVFDAIPLGTYTIWAEAKEYKPVTFKPKITLTELGEVVEIGLWPIWSVALAGVTAASVITVGAAKLVGWI